VPVLEPVLVLGLEPALVPALELGPV